MTTDAQPAVPAGQDRFAGAPPPPGPGATDAERDAAAMAWLAWDHHHNRTLARLRLAATRPHSDPAAPDTSG